MTTALLLLWIAATVSLAVALVVCGYHLFLWVVAAMPSQRKQPSKPARQRHYAILIPAHNEEEMLGGTLASCAALEYPIDHASIYVVADNCSDRTAEVARSHDVTCFERHDTELRGKGHALHWALPKVLARGCDAVIILDADCTIDAGALTTFDRYFTDGSQVLQANYRIENVTENATTLLLGMANALESDCFYAPKSRLGMAVFVRGTGMVFDRSVLEQLPWDANAIVEDSEFSIKLICERVPIRFVPDVYIGTTVPASNQQLKVQRARWIGGGTQFARKQTLRLFGAGLITGRLILLDAAFTTLVLSRPLIILQWLVTTLLCMALVLASRSPMAFDLLVATALIFIAYVLYAISAIVQLKIPSSSLWLLAQIPSRAFAYIVMAIGAALGGGSRGWQRTPRGAAIIPSDQLKS